MSKIALTAHSPSSRGANNTSSRGLTAGSRFPTIAFISLGCPKALVDSEKIITQLKKLGYEIINDCKKANLVIINTCGFINEAIEESLTAIGTALQENANVIITGCLEIQK